MKAGVEENQGHGEVPFDLLPSDLFGGWEVEIPKRERTRSPRFKKRRPRLEYLTKMIRREALWEEEKREQERLREEARLEENRLSRKRDNKKNKESGKENKRDFERKIDSNKKDKRKRDNKDYRIRKKRE